MKTSNLILKSAIVATLGLASMGAIAGTASFDAASTYAVEGIPSTGAVTIPAGITYTTTLGVDGSGLLTIALPTGVTFASLPAFTPGGGITGISVASGGIGSNAITINYTRTAAANGTVTLGAFQITGATALSSVTEDGDFQVSLQSTGFTNSNDDGSPLKRTLAKSARQLIVEAEPLVLQIKVAASSNATRWLDNDAGNTKTIATSGSVGTLKVAQGDSRKADNTGPYAFTSATASVTLTGNFTGVTSAYLAPVSQTCAATAPSSSTVATGSAITSSAITFSGVTPKNDARQVCLIVTGSSILQQTLSGVTASAQRDTFSATPTKNLGIVKYDGGVNTLNYVVGSGDGFASYLRVVNRDSVAVPVRVVVQSDAGTVSTGLLDTIPANTGKLYTTAQINTATGSALNSANDRAALTILTPGDSVQSDNLLANPNGTVLSLP